MPIVPSKEEMLLQAQLHRMKHRWESTGIEPSRDMSVFRLRGDRILPYYLQDSGKEPVSPVVTKEQVDDIINKISAAIIPGTPQRYVLIWDSLGALGGTDPMQDLQDAFGADKDGEPA